MLGIDIAPAIVNAITAFIQLHRIDKWCRLIFSILFSFFVSGAFVTGTALVARSSYAIALGSGLIAAAVSATVVFRTNELTRGLSVVLPAGEAGTEINTDLQTIDHK